MPVPYSYDLRTKVIEAIDRGMKKTEASVIFNVSRNTINLWLKKRAETGDYKAKENYRRGYGHKIKDWEKFHSFVQANGHKTQAEMAEAWSEPISQRTISRGLKKINFTRNKRLMAIKKEMEKN